jgi:hypothetical protein
MVWIQCEGGEVLGARYIRRFEVEAGATAHTKTHYHGDGSWDSITYPSLPGRGWLIVAWCGGVATGPRCVACYDTAEQAEQVLAGIFAELGEGERAVSVPVIRARLERERNR